MDISNYINKIQAEFDRRETDLTAREKALAEEAGQIKLKRRELSERSEEFEKETAEINAKRDDLRVVEQKIFTSEQLVQERRLAELDKISVQKTLKEAQELKAEVGQKENELAKRELELSKEKETYKEKLEKELTRKVLGAAYDL